MNTGLKTLSKPAVATRPSAPDPAVDAETGAALLRDRLFVAVAQALKVLLGAGELRQTIGQALRLLGEAAQMHRVKVILDQPVQADQAPFHALAYEWWAPGFESQTSLGVVNFPNAAMPEYLRPMRAGQSMWQLIDEVQVGLRAAFERVGMRSMGVVPIFAKDRYAGLVAFDDCVTRRRWSDAEIEALTIAAHAIGAAIERERLEAQRLQAEQARADQAEADSRALRQREGLLRTVTEASRALLAGSDFDAGIRAGMALLGTALDVIRVGLVQDLPLPQDDAPGRWRMTHEWAAAGVPAQRGSPAEAGAYPDPEVWQQLRRGESVVVRIDDDDGSFAQDQRAIRTRSVLAVPLFVADRWWGLLCFEQSRDHDWAEHELAVLKTAAACVSAALERERLEALRLAVERERADEALALNRLLEGVVTASKALLDEPDLDAGVARWLAHLGQAFDADAANIGWFSAPEQPSEVLARVTAEWLRPGVAPVDGNSVPATTDFLAWADAMCRGEIIFAELQDLRDPASVAHWHAQGIHAGLLVPVMLDQQVNRFIGIVWVRPHGWAPAFTALMHTAADGLAAAIKRHEALQALMTERERSANERSVELVQANAGMRRTLARLAAAEDVDAFLSTALLELRQQAGAEEAFLFAVDDGAGDALLRLRGSVRADGFQRQGEEGDPEVFTLGFVPTPQAMAAMKQGSWLLWRPVSDGQGAAPRHPQVQQWLLQRGHAADACCLLQVGERCVGLVVLHLAGAEPLASSRCELLVALSQPMALALELGRLSRAAQRAAQDRAVLAERNRMARDVHDTLAQGFTAISLQLQAASRAESAEDRARFVARATQEAQSNLVESRRTIRLLRGLLEPGEATHALVHVIEDALASRLSGSALPWRVLPLPEGVAEPALDEEVRRELKRITQEAATNALKHAKAPLFEASLSLRPGGTLALRLEDRGCGFNPKLARDGFGLLGMRERAERIGAVLQIDSQPGGPTAVVVLVPARSGDTA